MKWNSYITTLAVVFILSSCGGNSSDNEVVTTADTATTTPDTLVTVNPDTSNAIAVNVPENTKAAFKKKYPEATNVKWEKQKPKEEAIDWELSGWQEMDEEDDKAIFHWQGSDHQSRYDKKSNWVGTTNTITDHTKLPTAVINAVKKEYGGYTVSSVTKEDDKNRTAYEIILEKNGARVKALIDEQGNVVKRKNMK